MAKAVKSKSHRPRKAVTLRRLKQLLRYEPEIGYFFWLQNAPWKVAGKRAGRISPKGYVIICIDWIEYRAARLAWLWMTGKWPPVIVDHENLIKNDDRWDNLRLATTSQNGANSQKRRRNRTGLKGVDTQGDRFRSRIMKDGKQYNLGTFPTAEQASIAYEVKSSELFGEFARSR